VAEAVMDEGAIRAAVIVIAHVIFLSSFFLRFVHAGRRHLLRADVPWWVRFAPPLVWIPWGVAVFVDAGEIDLADGVRLGGLVLALLGAAFAGWAMWTLGRKYGIGVDLFAGHEVVDRGPYAIVRHPMYLGILIYHVGAALALADVLLLVLTLVAVLPYLAIRIVAEERVLRAGLPAYRAYAERVPVLLPFARPRLL
jgi:protein-S-isoprenylcysteine O-methyltransferase Ste14